MSRPLNPAQFRFVIEPDVTEHRTRFETEGGNTRMVDYDEPVSHAMTAYQGKTPIGRIQWGIQSGDITSTTHPDYRQQGIATRLYDRAREYSAENGLTMPSVAESFAVSPEGARMLASWRHRPVPEVYGQQPLFPRKGKNRTLPGPTPPQKPGGGIY